MASLTGNKIKDTYKSLLKVSDNGELEAASQEITDGSGNSTGVQLNTGGDLTASGTVAFGSLKDSGENITITKFVDEADGIALNDNDTTIPTSAAVKDYVDNNAAVTSVNTQTGAVVLDADDISDAATTNKFTNASDISKLAGIEAGAEVNPTASEIKTSYESNANTNAFTDAEQSKLSGIEAGADVTDATNVAAAGAMMSGVAVISDLSNVASTTPTDGQVLTYDTINGWQPEDAAGAVDSVNGQTGTVSLDTADLTDVDTTAPTDGQVLRYVSASSKYVPTTLSSTAPVDSVNGQTGAVVLDADDISDATTTNKYTTAADISKLAGIEAGAEVNPTASEIKTSYESNADTNAFTDAEKSKLAGIAAGAEVNAVDSVNTQTGAVVLDADDISDATTINKFTTAGDISKLAGIEAGADVTDSANVTTALGSISVTAHSDVTSAGSGAIITSAERTKLGGIEALADVTDATNVTSSLVAATAISAGDKTTIQTNLDVDPSGTDNSTNVTLAGVYDYLSLTGQQITLNQIDATTDISGLATVATSGAYSDLSGTPTIPSAPAIEDNAGTPVLATGITDAEIRTLINVDVAGTDNSTNVTLAGAYDYLTISGQEITRNQIDLTTDVTGSLPIANGGTGSTTASGALSNLGGDTKYTVSVIGTNTSAANDTLYILTASLTLTLPASPSAGDKIGVSNMSGTTTPTIARNGNNIAGLAEDLTLDVDNLGIQLVYSGATKGWILL